MDSRAIEMYGAEHIIPWQQKRAFWHDDLKRYTDSSLILCSMMQKSNAWNDS
jgi:hypothetical protein